MTPSSTPSVTGLCSFCFLPYTAKLVSQHIDGAQWRFQVCLGNSRLKRAVLNTDERVCESRIPQGTWQIADHVLILCDFLEIECQPSASVWCQCMIFRADKIKNVHHPRLLIQLKLNWCHRILIYTLSFCKQSVTRSDINMKHCSHDLDAECCLLTSRQIGLSYQSYFKKGQTQIDIVFLIIMTEFQSFGALLQENNQRLSPQSLLFDYNSMS